jgi:hypothetical protein
MKNAFFWEVTPYGSCKKRRFGGTCDRHHKDEKNQRASSNVKTAFFRVTTAKTPNPSLKPIPSKADMKDRTGHAPATTNLGLASTALK